MAPTFPFVVIPPSTTAAQLHQQIPFLCTAIMMSVTFQNVPKQMAMAKDIMTDLSVRLLQRGEKSMDLLQGLLVYSAWWILYVFQRSHIIHVLLLLSISFANWKSFQVSVPFSHQHTADQSDSTNLRLVVRYWTQQTPRFNWRIWILLWRVPRKVGKT
jgi:hypothetical protein